MTRDWNREQIILRRHEAGESLASIGRDFGITRERARQIVERNRPQPAPADDVVTTPDKEGDQ